MLTGGIKTIWQPNQPQAIAVPEGPIPNAGDAVGDGDGGQAGAIIKSPIPNADDAVGDVDRGQAGAVIESPISNAGDALWDDNPFKPIAP